MRNPFRAKVVEKDKLTRHLVGKPLEIPKFLGDG